MMNALIEIYLATPENSRLIEAIENDAMAAFGTVGLTQLASKLTPVGIYDKCLAANRVWLAKSETGKAIGFLAADILDGSPYLKEVSVLHAFQRTGVGRALISHFLAWARQEGFAEGTLTTFRDLPFNASFYASLGFQSIEPSLTRPQLAAQRLSEAHLDAMAPRVAMAISLSK